MHHIAYCFDKAYRPHFGASIMSLFLNGLKDINQITIHVVTDTIDDDIETKLIELSTSFGKQIKLHIPSQSQLDHLSALPTALHLTAASYFRLLLPALLPADIHKALYLDSDTIVLSSLRPLLETDIHSYGIAAALDLPQKEASEKLGVSQYFNTGVTLLNLQTWRQMEYAGQCIEFARNNPEKISFADQCAINYILQRNILTLDERWNKYILPSTQEEEIQPASILHFLTDKPWFMWYDGEISKWYLKYREICPWASYPLTYPRTTVEAWRYARLLKSKGRIIESIDIYEKLIQSLAHANRL